MLLLLLLLLLNVESRLLIKLVHQTKNVNHFHFVYFVLNINFEQEKLFSLFGGNNTFYDVIT